MDNNRETGLLNIDDTLYRTRISKKFLERKPYQKIDPNMVVSVIPGLVINIPVQSGQDVRKGDDLVVLDSMKMQNSVKCQKNGRIKKIFVNKGDKVAKGAILMELEQNSYSDIPE
jgi:biotin carboxyl carrier protein